MSQGRRKRVRYHALRELPAGTGGTVVSRQGRYMYSWHGSLVPLIISFNYSILSHSSAPSHANLLLTLQHSTINDSRAHKLRSAQANDYDDRRPTTDDVRPVMPHQNHHIRLHTYECPQAAGYRDHRFASCKLTSPMHLS